MDGRSSFFVIQYNDPKKAILSLIQSVEFHIRITNISASPKVLVSWALYGRL